VCGAQHLDPSAIEINAAATPLHRNYLAQNLRRLHRFIGDTRCITTQDKAGTTMLSSLYTHHTMRDNNRLQAV